MTEGHKHRELRVRKGGLIQRALTRPLYHTRTTDYDASRAKFDRIDRSPYPYGPCQNPDHSTASVHCWYLSALSILHRWTGLTLRFPDDTPED
jgi:hypothetical protein